ncbi:MAG: hypothetical protein V5A64_06545 [Candidatus Thermoplasmatota archaeon]
MNIKALVAGLLIFATVLLGLTYLFNVEQIETNNRDTSSYHFVSPIIYMFFGTVSLLSTWVTHRVHIGLGMFTLILGILTLSYGAYLFSIKMGFL